MSPAVVRKISCLVFALALMFLATSSTGIGQEATPGPECVAPALPEGTPTPLDENGEPISAVSASPEAEPAGDMTGHDMSASETAASAEVAAAAEAGLGNVLACLNSGDYIGLAALMTPSMIEFVTGFSANPYDIPVVMEGSAPIEVVATGDTTVDDTGRVGVQIVYRGLFAVPGTMQAERWYLVDVDGVWKLDGISMTTAQEGFMPEATVVEVQLVDFAFALTANEIPAGPVILRFSNTSYSHQGHVGVVVAVEELSAEQIIEGEELPEDQVTGYYGSAYVEPGSVADLIFENLEAGTYTLACDVPTADGVEHWQLGMVAQFDVV